MGRRHPVSNGVSCTPWFRKLTEERSQRVGGSCVRGGVAPVDLGVDHLALKPAPNDKGLANLGMEIVECWSEFAHLIRVHEDRY